MLITELPQFPIKCQPVKIWYTNTFTCWFWLHNSLEWYSWLNFDNMDWYIWGDFQLALVVNRLYSVIGCINAEPASISFIMTIKCHDFLFAFHHSAVHSQWVSENNCFWMSTDLIGWYISNSTKWFDTAYWNNSFVSARINRPNLQRRQNVRFSNQTSGTSELSEMSWIVSARFTWTSPILHKTFFNRKGVNCYSHSTPISMNNGVHWFFQHWICSKFWPSLCCSIKKMRTWTLNYSFYGIFSLLCSVLFYQIHFTRSQSVAVSLSHCLFPAPSLSLSVI